MPLRDLNEDREPGARAMLFGHVRLGIFNGRHPQQSDTLIFTTADVERLKPLQRDLGGTIERYEPQGAGEEPWRLVSEAEAITFLFPFSEPEGNLSQSWELWTAGGIKRRCDGFQCALVDVDEITGERSEETVDCICAAGERECAPTTRLRLLLPQTGIGIWELTTGSIVGATQLYDQVRFIAEVATGRMNHVPIRLVYAPRRISYFDQKERKRKTTTKRIVSLSVAGDAAHSLGALGLDPDRALISAVRTVLEEHEPALPSGGPSPPGEPRELTVGEGEAASTPAEPSPPGATVSKAEIAEAAKTLGMSQTILLKNVRDRVDAGEYPGPKPDKVADITRTQLDAMLEGRLPV